MLGFLESGSDDRMLAVIYRRSRAISRRTRSGYGESTGMRVEVGAGWIVSGCDVERWTMHSVSGLTFSSRGVESMIVMDVVRHTSRKTSLKTSKDSHGLPLWRIG